MLDASWVAASMGHAGYPNDPPYSPSEDHPEYPFDRRTLAHGANSAYEGVRGVLSLLQPGASHANQQQWNPLGTIVRPGDTVVLKPNFIRDFRETLPGHDDCLITHGSVIRAVTDYVYIALSGQGRIIIADAPQGEADFGAIRRMAGLDEIQEFYRRHAHFEVEVYDLRLMRTEKVNGVIVGHVPLPGDPAGYVKVDLGPLSAFAEIAHLCHLLYGSEYDTHDLRHHHHDNVHEYLLSRTVLSADCVINLPKLKTHKKTGITVCLKNLVGINGNKNWLPHHREGTPAQGGDQFADDGRIHRVERVAMTAFRRLFPLLGPLRRVVGKPLKAAGTRVFGATNSGTIRSGNWYGNDTTWRMVLDLNRVFLYANAEGELQDKPARRAFHIVDGIVAGEGNGPLDATPKRVGIVLAGANPVAVDLVCARVMGFDFTRMPMLHKALEDLNLALAGFGIDGITVRSDGAETRRLLIDWESPCSRFMPPLGWQGHVEAAPSLRFI